MSAILSADHALLDVNDDIHVGYQQRAADSTSAAASRRHDNSDAQKHLQFTPASHLLSHLRRAFTFQQFH